MGKKYKLYLRPIGIIIAIVGLIVGIYFFFGCYAKDKQTEWVAISVALLLGTIGLFQSMIVDWSLRPFLEVQILTSPEAEIYEGENIKSYNLAVKNIGLSSAKKIRAKVKESFRERKKDYLSWLNLMRPFSNLGIKNSITVEKIQISELEKIYISNLSRGEEDYFNFGNLKSNGSFRLIVNTPIDLNNQSITTGVNETRYYELVLVADNMRSQSYQIQIKKGVPSIFQKSPTIMEN